MLGVIGDDGFGYELERALAARGISERLLREEPRGSDLHLHQADQLPDRRGGSAPRRLRQHAAAARRASSANWSRRFERVAGDYDVILVSDQAETSQGGVVTPALREAISRAAAAQA